MVTVLEGAGLLRGDRRSSAWPQALLVLLAVAVSYANALEGPFLFDDKAPRGELSWGQRPLVWLSMALNMAMSGNATWSYHVFNVLVHAGCALLLLALLRHLLVLGSPALAPRMCAGLALAVTLIWAVHPLQTESVTYVIQRAESLASFFTLAFLYAFVRAASGERALRWQVLALSSLGLALASKQMAAVAPILAWLLEATLLSKSRAVSWRARWRFQLVLALTWIALLWIFVAPALLSPIASAGFGTPSVTELEYLRSQPGVILHYLRLALWPQPLCLDYGWPVASDWPAIVFPSLVVVALAALTLGGLLRRSWIGFAGAWFFVLLAPTSSFLPIQDLAVEHRMYLPLAAVALLAVVGGRSLCARALPRAHWLPHVLAAALVLALSATTRRRNEDYGSEITMWQSVVACRPHNSRAYTNLSGVLIEAGRTEEATKALQTAIALDPSATQAYNNLAVIEMNSNRLDAAVATLTRAIVADVRHDVSYSNMGVCYLRRGEPARAILYFEQALKRLESPHAHRGLATAYLELRDFDRAEAHFRRALELDPDDAPAQHGLARALAR